MTDKDYDTISVWVDRQNKKIPRVKYWIEATDENKGKAKNASGCPCRCNYLPMDLKTNI